MTDTPKKIIQPNGLFTTFKTMEELETYFDNFNGAEKASMWKGAMFMWNHLAHVLNEAQ